MSSLRAATAPLPAGDINLRGAITSDQWRRKSKGIRSLGREWRLSPSPNVFLQRIAHQTENGSVAIVISMLCYEYYNTYYACIVSATSRLESRIFEPSVC